MYLTWSWRTPTLWSISTSALLIWKVRFSKISLHHFSGWFWVIPVVYMNRSADLLFDLCEPLWVIFSKVLLIPSGVKLESWILNTLEIKSWKRHFGGGSRKTTRTWPSQSVPQARSCVIQGIPFKIALASSQLALPCHVPYPHPTLPNPSSPSCPWSLQIWKRPQLWSQWNKENCLTITQSSGDFSCETNDAKICEPRQTQHRQDG